MNNNNNRIKIEVIRAIKGLNLFLMTFPFAIAWFCYYAPRTYSPYYAKGNYLIIALFFLLYAVYAKLYNALQVSITRIRQMIYSQCLAIFIADSIMYVVTWLLTKFLPNIIPLICAFMVQCVIAVIWAWTANHFYFKNFPAKKTAIIYDKRTGVESLIKNYHLDRKFEVTCVISAEECINHSMRELKQVEDVFLCGIHSHERNMILKYCVLNGIGSYVFPRIGDILMSSAKEVHILHLPILRVVRYNPPFEYVFIKRFMDVTICGIALVVLLPIMLITAIAIKVTDNGPIFYKQCRLTKDGEKFDVLKFRSMRVDAEKDGVARLSTGTNDDRVTPVGKFIRKVRIDELPQLLNIIKGDMTIVGPRPERPEIAKQYEKELPEFALRLQAKAGLTGLAQVYGKYNTTPYDKLQMDLMYIANPSILEDIKIMFATVKILFTPESTEGVSEGQETALKE